jgi:hypothetical protein
MEDMFEMLSGQSVSMYIMMILGFMQVLGQSVFGGILAKTARESDVMSRAKNRNLKKIIKRYEEMSSLEAGIENLEAFVDKYMNRMRVLAIPVNVWESILKNLALLTGVTGIFSAIYQYYVVGNVVETVKLSVGVLAAAATMQFTKNMCSYSVQKKILRDNVRNYLDNQLSYCVKKREKRSTGVLPYVAATKTGVAEAKQLVATKTGVAEEKQLAATESMAPEAKQLEDMSNTDVPEKVETKKTVKAGGDTAVKKRERDNCDAILDRMMEKLLMDG